MLRSTRRWIATIGVATVATAAAAAVPALADTSPINYCNRVLMGAYEDCPGSFEYLTDNKVSAESYPVCAGAKDSGGALYGSYLCDNNGYGQAEHVYAGTHNLQPIAHNHGYPGNPVGAYEYF